MRLTFMAATGSCGKRGRRVSGAHVRQLIKDASAAVMTRKENSEMNWKIAVIQKAKRMPPVKPNEAMQAMMAEAKPDAGKGGGK